MTKNKQLIFLHGWRLDKNCFSELEKQLNYNKVLFDLPGFGDTELPKRPWGTLDYANYVKNNFLIKPSILVGYSFGGRIAIKLAINYPELVEKIILISSSGLRKEISLKRCWRRFWKKSSKDYQQAGALKPILSKIVREDLTQDLKKIKCPVLLLWGEQDKETPIWIAKKMHKLIANSKLIILPNLDHWSILDLGASQLAHQIDKFLKLL